jgi:hypothetical protein
MKFSPTWQQVALLTVLLAAVIVVHLVAPLAVSVITSIVSTIVGALFVNLHPSKPLPYAMPDEPTPPAEAASARVLTLVPPPKDDAS